MSYRTEDAGRFGIFCAYISPEIDHWDREVHVHTKEEILFFSKKGSCTVINNGSHQHIPTPAFIWNRAGSFHLVSDITNKEESYSASYHPQILSGIYKQLLNTDFAGDSGLCAIPLDEKSTKRMIKLFEALMGSPSYQRRLLFLCIFHQAAQSLAPGTEPIHSGNISGYIYEVVALLQKQGGEKLTLDALAERFHVGKTKLKADFKKVTNMPIHSFRLRQQLHAARAQMTTTKLPLAQIATECGFTDESHLIRAFRAEFGITPGAFRRRYTRELKKRDS